jgi:hypothetical protein
MATSGTYTFNLDIAEIIEEAFERCGLELRTGYDLETARRSLNLLLLEWANEGIHLFTLDQYTQDLVASTASYTLPTEVIDVVSGILRDVAATPDVDHPMTAISLSHYLNISDKTQSSLPHFYCTERNTSSVTLRLWPTPSLSTYDFIYWGFRHIQDIGDHTNNPDVAKRFLPSLIAGLAYHLSLKRNKEVDINLRQELLLHYTKVFDMARYEDRERSSVFLVPTYTSRRR